ENANRRNQPVLPVFRDFVISWPHRTRNLRQEIAMNSFLVFVVAASAIAVRAAGDVQAPASANAANGKRLFEKVGCYECHGYGAQGGRDGARLAARSKKRASFSRQ